MAGDFQGLKKEDKDELDKAVKLYAATGKDLRSVVSSIPVAPTDPKEKEEADKKKAEAENEKAEKQLELQAAAQRAKEKADQAGRKIAAHTDDAGNLSMTEEEQEALKESGALQPGNPGGGQAAPATERAKAQGRGRPEVTAPPTRSR